MVESVTPPVLREPLPGLGDPLLPVLELPNRLRQKMPPELFAVIEGEARTIRREVIVPILHAEDEDKLRELFRTTAPEYARHALLISLLVWSALRESLVGWFPETCRTLRDAIEELGPDTIGRQSTDACLSGLSAFALVIRGFARAVGAHQTSQTSVQFEALDELFRWALAFNVALLSVVVFLHDGANGGTSEGPATRNAQVLAHWARYYGVGSYKIARSAGVLRVPQQGGEAPYTTDELLDIAETGISDVSQQSG